MKKALILFLCLILSISFITACAKKEEEEEEPVVIDEAILGRWEESYWDSGYVFNEDATGEDIFWGQTFSYTTTDGRLSLQYDEGTWAEKVFTYSVSGDVLTLTQVLPDGSAEEAGSWEYYKVQ